MQQEPVITYILCPVYEGTRFLQETDIGQNLNQALSGLADWPPQTTVLQLVRTDWGVIMNDFTQNAARTIGSDASAPEYLRLFAKHNGCYNAAWDGDSE